MAWKMKLRKNRVEAEPFDTAPKFGTTGLFRPQEPGDISDVELSESSSEEGERLAQEMLAEDNAARSVSEAPTAKPSLWKRLGNRNSSATGESVSEPGDAQPAAEPAPAKKTLWQRLDNRDNITTGESFADPGDARPLKVLIGYLPDASEKDTFFYMLGVADKSLDSESISGVAMAKYKSGYAYEIHEGGDGRSYLDAIIKYFNGLPPYDANEPYRVHIRTAMRTIRVERTGNGLYAVILPESDKTPQSEWLVGGRKLKPLVDKRTGFLIGASCICALSFFALLGGFITRYAPQNETTVRLERVPVSQLPHAQWSRLVSLADDDYAKALKFENKKWVIQTPSDPTGSGIKKAKTPKPAEKKVELAVPEAAAPFQPQPVSGPVPAAVPQRTPVPIVTVVKKEGVRP